MVCHRIPGLWRAGRHGVVVLAVVALGAVAEAGAQDAVTALKTGRAAAKCLVRSPAWDDELRGATLADALQGKIPGVTVAVGGGGAAGGVGTVRIRGANSIQSNAPLVFVDDMRVTALPATGTYAAPLLEFVDVSQIERIEILRGPAATLRHGQGAAAGVIKIYTRRGRSETQDARERDCSMP